MFGEDAVVEETDDELENGHHRPRKGEKGLPLRGGIDLDDPEYEGRRVSRDAVFGDESEDAISEDEDVETGSEEYESEGQLGDEQGARAEPESAVTNGADIFEDEVDEEAAALEREFEAARAGTTAADMAITNRDRAARERAKGTAVKNQRALWERMLELRILLQSCLQASNRLVRPHMHVAACAVAPELRSGFHGLADGAAATLDSLLDLHDELLERVPDRAAAAATEPPAEAVMGKTGKKRGRDGAAGDDLLSGTKWARMNAAYGSFAPFRDASMDRWHRKTMLMTGSGALRNNLRALNQSLSSQVAALVTDSGPAVQRTQLMTAQIRPLMGRASAQADQDEDADDEDEPDETVLDARDAETFDDGEFYQQLLKEFLEGSGVDAAAVNASAQGGKKKRKKVDRRASKGRKLRYQVMEKLVHFMTPVERAEAPTLATQLFANLFGQGRSMAGGA
ncbi:TRAUB-domain-containing protein [Coccomyxa subellipsoidea C-169]|uniref:TRAUB-domain-containing protein n=1 Tax=Coccomyxa subellipsoidea (strain C-169) TaxID=574566 RepID=I0Z6P3_COCSC|nr:TRAUB-domain-containing protein [Coccomyxa subellipsoidea C-169]EIE26312.1 TRAUB-domain-containing protein [Coccomyxa subellipsoidea C-169]|eukprot:XP_005650856.1 TRAUB-domain-containing protein [Coccomyxa subellipsoidea C-169]